jgi:hypothetical protein
MEVPVLDVSLSRAFSSNKKFGSRRQTQNVFEASARAHLESDIRTEGRLKAIKKKFAIL